MGVYSSEDWRTLKTVDLEIGCGRGDLFKSVAYVPNSHTVLVAGGQYVTITLFGRRQGSWNGRVWFFDSGDQVPGRSIKAYRAGGDHGGSADVRWVTASPDGKYIVTSAKTGAGDASYGIASESVHVLRIADGQLVGAPLDGMQPMKFAGGVANAYTHDGRYIVVPHEVQDGWIHVIDGQTFKVVDLVKADGFCFDIAVNQVNDEFAVGAGNRVTVWSLPRK